MRDKLINLSISITDGEHGSLKNKYTNENGFYVFSMENIYNNNINIKENQPKVDYDTFEKIQRKSKVTVNSVLLTAVGDLGRTALVRDDNINFCFISGVVIINTDKSKLLPKYLYYYLQSPISQYRLKNCGSTNSNQKHFVLQDAEEFEVDYPELNKQQEIVDLIDPVELKIHNNNTIIESLSNKIKDIFTYWFVDYNFPDSNRHTHKDNYGVSNNKLPIGWSYMSFTDNSLFKLVPVGVDLFEGNKIYLSTSQVTQDDYDLDSNIITYENRESRANMQPVINSVWFARMKNSIKHLCFDDSGYLVNELILSTGFCGVYCDPINFEYVYSLINSDWFEEIKNVYSSGSTQESITDLILSYIKIKIPSKDVLERFHNVTKNDLKMILKLKKENDVLKKYKSFLLQTLFK